MYIGKRCYQQDIQQTGVKQGLGVYVIKFYKLNQQTHCVYCVPSSLFIEKDSFQPLKSHYQGVKIFINENVSNRGTSVVNFMSQAL